VTNALATSAITSPTAGTATIVVTSIATPAACGLTVTNGTGAGNNTNVFNLAGAFGVGIASTVAPVIASVSPTTALNSWRGCGYGDSDWIGLQLVLHS